MFLPQKHECISHAAGHAHRALPSHCSWQYLICQVLACCRYPVRLLILKQSAARRRVTAPAGEPPTFCACQCTGHGHIPLHVLPALCSQACRDVRTLVRRLDRLGQLPRPPMIRSIDSAAVHSDSFRYPAIQTIHWRSRCLHPRLHHCTQPVTDPFSVCSRQQRHRLARWLCWQAWPQHRAQALLRPQPPMAAAPQLHRGCEYRCVSLLSSWPILPAGVLQRVSCKVHYRSYTPAAVNFRPALTTCARLIFAGAVRLCCCCSHAVTPPVCSWVRWRRLRRSAPGAPPTPRRRAPSRRQQSGGRLLQQSSCPSSALRCP